MSYREPDCQIASLSPRPPAERREITAFARVLLPVSSQQTLCCVSAWYFSAHTSIMPLGLFGNKFTPKKTPPRRAQSLSNLNLDADQSRHEFGVDSYSGVKLNLGGQEVAFENGMWVTESGVGGGSQREMMRLKKTNQQLSEENNLLKLKVDILLDMLAEMSAISHFHENELKQLRDSKSKRR